MDQSPENHPEHVPPDAAGAGSVRNGSEGFGNVPNSSEGFRTVRKGAESFRSVAKLSERKENHTLTVRETARMFEAAGVARTERSIINWCQPNKMGVPRLDSYFDPNERRYYITPQSVDLAIAEERAKAAKINESSKLGGSVLNGTEGVDWRPERREIRDLENEMRDLQITNKAKDIVIDRMQKERDGIFNQLLAANRKVGELETKLLQLERPKEI